MPWKVGLSRDFGYNLGMELEQQLNTIIEQQLWSLEHDRGYFHSSRFCFDLFFG